VSREKISDRISPETRSPVARATKIREETFPEYFSRFIFARHVRRHRDSSSVPELADAAFPCQKKSLNFHNG
jgi:hypothetical protein